MRTISRHMTRKEPVDEHGTWAVSYGDMITLLLTFFILFFSTDSKQTHFRLLQNALVDQLKQAKTSETTGFTNRLDMGKDRGHDIDQLVQRELGAKVTKMGRALVVEFPNVSFFKLGEIPLTKDGTETLKHFVKVYERFAGSFRLGVKAYTDHKPVRNGERFKDNLELSALRSVSAMRVLQLAGIPLRQMHIEGQGEFPPRSPSSTGEAAPDKADPLARKVVLIVEPDWKTESI